MEAWQTWAEDIDRGDGLGEALELAVEVVSRLTRDCRWSRALVAERFGVRRGDVELRA